ncbi:MAG: D-alanyl-D-alanine carboxypeptidase [Notoacmeibacter sp.]|nr:D-alanyl-D-alanine carboxypeptidase [Notoacmeibacter sp.]
MAGLARSLGFSIRSRPAAGRKAWPHVVRSAALALVGIVAVACSTTEALKVPVPVSDSPKYAAIVIDANSRQVLYAKSANETRYPASLTKMMTLYILFEGLSSGKLSKSTRIPVSAYAASRPPSKLGLKAGQTVTVETAIYALVTKSANDVASAVGEYLGGSESGFGRIMTAKARSLGMSRTTFRNPHGLPDAAQVTTARDMAKLGMALREHFPQYYDYFSTRSFTYGKRRMGNHNKLLGRVQGVDGIKTGYTRASGFNLVTSAVSGKKRIVAVVLGGRTGASRNAQMTALVKEYLPKASGRQGGQLIAKTRTAPITVASAAPAPKAKALPKTDIPLPKTKPETVQTADAATPKAPVPLVDPVRTASVPDVKGWVIQVASLPSRDEAVAFIEKTRRNAGGALARAEGFTSTFEKDGTVYYRARFAGFSGKSAAWNTCAALKRQKIGCYATQQ